MTAAKMRTPAYARTIHSCLRLCNGSSIVRDEGRAPTLPASAETLRKWVRQCERDAEADEVFAGSAGADRYGRSSQRSTRSLPIATRARPRVPPPSPASTRQDRHGDQERAEDDDRVDTVRKDVAQQDARGSRPGGPGRLHVLALLHGEGGGPRDAGEPRDVAETDAGDDGPEAGAERGHDGEREDQRPRRLEHIDGAYEEVAGEARKYPGERPTTVPATALLTTTAPSGGPGRTQARSGTGAEVPGTAIPSTGPLRPVLPVDSRTAR
jgi:hypothetical protein